MQKTKPSNLFMNLLLIVFIIILLGNTFISLDAPSYNLNLWLNGYYCEGFCWQNIHQNMTADELESYLQSNSIEFRASQYKSHYQWTEAQPIAPDGLDHLTVVFSEEGQLIRIIADIKVCIDSIVEEFGVPNDIRRGENVYSITYLDDTGAWVFHFSSLELPYAGVIMRVYNEPHFSLDMMQNISWGELSNTLSILCEDDFIQ